MKTIDMIQIGYNSEWFLGKAYQALKERKIERRINLVSVCGVEDTKEDAINNLQDRKAKNKKIKAYGARNLSAEMKSINMMTKRLKNRTLDYHHVNGDFSLPLRAHEGGNRIVYICSTNRTHVGYLEDAVKHGAHVILEKPAIVVMDENGDADDSQLRELENIVKKCPTNLKLIDAEHYAHKEASEIFYSKLEEILASQQIKKVECTLYEPDQSDKERNVYLLNRKSRTGLLTDTGVHLLSFVSNLGASAHPIKERVKYGMHARYNVETSVNAEYRIKNDEKKRIGEKSYFTPDATISLDLEKFSKERKERNVPETKKTVVFTLTDDTEVVVDLLRNTVVKRKDREEDVSYKLNRKYNKNEYVNVMQDAHATISGKQPRARSELRDSLKTMRAIYETYLLTPITNEENIEERY